MNIQRLVTIAGVTLTVTVTDMASIIEDRIRFMGYSETEKIVVGLDVEWNSSDPNNKVAILQLCSGTSCLIIQLPRLDYIPQLLKDFLADRNVTFVGVGISGDALKLRRDHGLACENAMEIGALAATVKRDPRLARAGLVGLAREVLGLEVNKFPDVGRYSDWSATPLGYDQMVYAATDAFVSYLIGAALLEGD
ncbi:LOW QUALITY PROTEIN: uncharacterized protein [Elaeis guineensis]|uniref:LOW QUALITY PROTEIN: uncharacterized protein n=1 Tax=Elaeis guineensis var. tenera TaxID=51953 RepID=UPI003C6D8372